MATRRQYLRQAGAAGSVALLATTAGCSGDGGGGGDGGGDGDGGDGGSTGGGSGGLTAGVLTTLQLDTGIATERGAELAAQKINSEGMLDSDVSIASEDTEGQSTVAVEAYNSLVNQENADLTLGTFAEQTGAAILPEIASSRTIHTNVGAISPELPTNLREDYEQFKPWFRVYPPNAAFFVIDMLNFTEQFLVGEQGWSSTALFREDAAWTEQVGGALKQQFPEMGLEVQDDIVFSLSENNFSPYMNQIQDMDVDVVFGLIAEAGKAPLLSYEQAGVTTPLAGSVVAAQSPAYLSDINAEDSPIVNQNHSTWGADHPAPGQEFVDTYTATYDSRPSKPTWAAFGAYAAVMMWAKARAQGGDDLDATITALEETSFQLSQTYEVYKPGEEGPDGQVYPHDNKYGEDLIQPMWSQWQDGEMKTVYPERFANADYQAL